VAEAPLAATVTLVGPLAASVKSMPMPESMAAWVPEGALSVRVRVPDSGPAAVGANSIVIAQAAFAARVVVQALEAMVKPALAVIAEIVSGRPPLLVRVSVCGWVVRPTPVAAKLSDAGLSETPGGAMPVPES
jgi:hypothetical protein